MTVRPLVARQINGVRVDERAQFPQITGAVAAIDLELMYTIDVYSNRGSPHGVLPRHRRIPMGRCQLVKELDAPHSEPDGSRTSLSEPAGRRHRRSPRG